MEVPRLGGAGDQRRLALRPLRGGAAGRRRAAGPYPRHAGGHGLLPAGHVGRRGAGPQAGARRRHGRHRRRHGAHVPRDRPRVCTLPRPQGRPDPATRLLPVRGLLRGRQAVQVEPVQLDRRGERAADGAPRLRHRRPRGGAPGLRVEACGAAGGDRGHRAWRRRRRGRARGRVRRPGAGRRTGGAPRVRGRAGYHRAQLRGGVDRA